MADDGYVLEYRNFDEGKNPFSWNIDRKTMTPLFMFDAAKVGANALRAEDIGNPAKPGAIIKETNAVPFDPNAAWKEGDILPGPPVQPGRGEGLRRRQRCRLRRVEGRHLYAGVGAQARYRTSQPTTRS